MKEYIVKLTLQAVEQMSETVRYISRTLLAPDAAGKWSARLQKEIASLNTMPLRFPLTEEEPWHTEGIHKMPVENFLVYYWVDEDQSIVWITAVVYGRRDQLIALREMPME